MNTYHRGSKRKKRTSIRALLVPTILPTHWIGCRATVITKWSEITHVLSDVLVAIIYAQGGKITYNIQTSKRHYSLQDGQGVHLHQVVKISHDSRRYQEVNLPHRTKDKRYCWTTKFRGISQTSSTYHLHSRFSETRRRLTPNNMGIWITSYDRSK